MATATSPTTTLAAAISYAARGWRVLPVHGVTDSDACDCGSPDCGSPGKHPVAALVPRGLHDATADLATIMDWWRRHPGAGVACATGPESGIAVIDIDLPGGEESLAKLEAEHGALPPTVEARTGSGGRHLIYQYPAVGCRSSAGSLGAKVDTRGAGGYIVAPPSRHASGTPYSWSEGHAPGQIALAPMPAWVPDFLAHRNGNRKQHQWDSAPTGERVGVGARNQHLASLGGTMRRRGMTESAIHAALAEENQERCDPPLPESEIAAVARSVVRYQPVEPAPVQAPATSNVDDDAEPIAEPWPEPVGEAAYYGILGSIVRTIAPETEADPVGILLQLLCAVGCLIGRGVYWTVGPTRHHSALYVALVARTGAGRKGTGWSWVRHLVELAMGAEWVREHIRGGIASGEGLIELLRDATPDQTGGLPDKRLLVCEEELVRVLQVMARDGSTVSAIMRQMWDRGAAESLTRRAYGASDAHMSLVAHGTPREIRQRLSSGDIAGGWGNRIAWACARRVGSLPSGGRSVDLSGYVEPLREALQWAETAGEIRRDEDADALWRDVYDSELMAERPGVWGALTERAAPYVMRMACIYAAMDRTCLIRREHLQAALAVWRYCDASVRTIWGDATGDDTADRLRAHIVTHPGCTRTTLSQALGRHVDTRRIAAALAELMRYRLAHSRPGPRTGGRAPQLWYPGPPPDPSGADNGSLRREISEIGESTGVAYICGPDALQKKVSDIQAPASAQDLFRKPGAAETGPTSTISRNSLFSRGETEVFEP